MAAELSVTSRPTSGTTAVVPAADSSGVASAGERAQPRHIQLRRWMVLLVATDAVGISLAVVTVLLIRFGVALSGVQSVRYPIVVGLTAPLWLALMALAGAYDTRQLATGFELYRRVINGALWMLALLAFLSFALRADISRALILASIPLAAAFTIVGRYALRKGLHRRLGRMNATLHRVLVIGLASDVRELVAHVNRSPHAGFRVVAAVAPDGPSGLGAVDGVKWVGGDPTTAVEQAQNVRADMIAVAAPQLLEPGQLRRLSWDLEGTDVELVLAPAITDVAGPRISTRPIAGLPLLCVEKPQFSGPRRVVKGAMDKSVSLAGLAVLSPILLGIAIAVKVTSRGPVLFVQERVGLNGRAFLLLKFRSMREGAESQHALLAAACTRDSPLFKLRYDPRRTPIGRFLRRWSLDELPQLLNVVRGDMSLVGPRPPLPSEVARYGVDVHRRLSVKPGMTGLWQVSGRADLSWAESVRLDLHYVDNWSVGLDFLLLAKTLVSVVRGDGAY